ncbi:Atxe2 family lasso peptide isopeptidase [Sphingobium terrigena]|uniref:Atxe2 family lasso peptide isopeptidase n=1 Tax=Sphingobium terrigena TaxID=2304063 RepID=A0A418YNW4_9SPHN|nr:Atxe2 family lasso peptide isopeptidase [Sphingobium terrigena]RJG52942.1 Atxe2 family lasso peptide isopeptidase [Sphingobium terrigena]
MRSVALLAACAGVIAAASQAEAATPETSQVCRNLLDDGANGHVDRRGVTTTDLIGLRDIGPNFGTDLPESPLALSPDGKHLAFVISRADPVLNDYCQALVTIDAQSHAPAQIVDMSNGLIIGAPTIRGFRMINGSPIINGPHWSPDGRYLAYLVSIEGIPQARVISVEKATALFTTTSKTAVRQVAWTPGGRLLFGNEPDAARLEAEIDRRGREGFLYDDSFIPNREARPSIRAPIPIEFHSSTASGADIRPAHSEELATHTDAAPDRPSNGLIQSVVEGGNVTAQLVHREPASLTSPIDLWLQYGDGQRRRCDDPVCAGGILNMWWTRNGQRLLFLRRAGWGNSELQLYSWDTRSAPDIILKTHDLITGCQLASPTLICLHEASSQPRRIVQINTDTGALTTLFDPNPSFHKLRKGIVERLHWTNDVGIESFGDLVLPRNRPRNSKIPLIVVQYLTRGFLRGGVGDEYPIFPFAEQGFAVLSLQRPADYYTTMKDGSVHTALEAQALNQRNWNDRRSVQSALVKGVELVASRGNIDTKRIGITGLSDGVSTVQFALVNSPGLFAAASISTGFQEPKSTQIYGGSAWAKQLVAMGYPPLNEDQTEFWLNTSIERNIAKINLPILMQVSDNEYLMAMESYGILKAYNRPTELYVFPNENHIKNGPAHRLAIYARNIDWFKFWLEREEDVTIQKSSPYERWNSLASRKDKVP